MLNKLIQNISPRNIKTVLSGLYKIESPNGEIYIGKSENLYERLMSYRRIDNNHSKKVSSNRLIEESIMEHGYKSHRFEIIFILPIQFNVKWLSPIEDVYIKHYYKMGNKMLNTIGLNASIDYNCFRKINKAKPKVIYEIVDTKNNIKYETENIKFFGKMMNLPYPSTLNNTLYGYSANGSSAKHYCGYTVISKRYQDITLDNNILQKEIDDIIKIRQDLRLLNNTIDQKSPKFGEKQQISHAKFIFKIINIKNPDIIYTERYLSNFLKANGYTNNVALMDTWYGYNLDNCRINSLLDFKIIDIQPLNQTKKMLDAYDKICNRKIERELFYKESIKNKNITEELLARKMTRHKITYKILHIESGIIYDETFVGKFCKLHNILNDCMLYDSLYGYNRQGSPITNSNGYKIIAKTSLDNRLPNDVLQNDIADIISTRIALRKSKNIGDNSCYSYKLLHIESDIVIDITNLKQFSEKMNFIYKNLHRALSTDRIHKGYKLIEKIRNKPKPI